LFLLLLPAVAGWRVRRRFALRVRPDLVDTGRLPADANKVVKFTADSNMLPGGEERRDAQRASWFFRQRGVRTSRSRHVPSSRREGWQYGRFLKIRMMPDQSILVVAPGRPKRSARQASRQYASLRYRSI
jgi:hypothetical protein